MADAIDECIAAAVSRYRAIGREVEGVVQRVEAIDKQMGRAVERTLACRGLKYGDYRLLLRLVGRSGGDRMSVGGLAGSLLLTASAMTHKIDQLERRGFLRRVHAFDDRRRVDIELTAEGRALIDEAVSDAAASKARAIRALTARELDTLNGLLRKVLSSIETCSHGGAMTASDKIAPGVRDRYGAAARAVAETGSTGIIAEDEAGTFGAALYGDLVASVPVGAAVASLGCGNPVAVADLRAGETVLDLGSGGGLDVLLSARRVGPTGRAIGLDATDEMLELARRNARLAGATNVEFLRGAIEHIPLPACSVDVVISNCVISLSIDRPTVFAEIVRVLRPGGRVGISDLLADDDAAADDLVAAAVDNGCVEPPLNASAYRDALVRAGLDAVTVTPTQVAGRGIHAAIICATKPCEVGP